MKTKRLKYNMPLRVGVCMVVIAVISLIVLIFTFAKYSSQGGGTDVARVAKWGLEADIPTDLDLFDGSYTNRSIIDVSSLDGSNVIAPGTEKTASVKLASFDSAPPEVMYHFETRLNIIDEGSAETSLIEKLDANPAFSWTLTIDGSTSTYSNVASICAAVEAFSEQDIKPGCYPEFFGGSSSPTLTIGWKWIYDASGQWDELDTELGNLAASANDIGNLTPGGAIRKFAENGSLSCLKVLFRIKAYQCEGGCIIPPISELKPLVRKFNGNDRSFLPAYYGDVCPANFYTINEMGDVEKIKGITDMASFYSAVANLNTNSTPRENIKKVYTDASGVTFYGVGYVASGHWSDYFKGISDRHATGFTETTLNALNAGNYTTVYSEFNGEDEEHPWDASTCDKNWDKGEHWSSEYVPYVGSVSYMDFYNAYCRYNDTNNTILYGTPTMIWAHMGGLKVSSYRFQWNIARESSGEVVGHWIEAGSSDSKSILVKYKF